MSTKVAAPKPTANELALQKLSLDFVKKQAKEYDELKPYALAAMRLTDDGSGGIRMMTEDEYYNTMGDIEKYNYNNLKLQLERQNKALKGELPLSEGLLQQKSKEFSQFKEAMARAGNPIEGDEPGSAIAQTTSGIQGLKSFQDRWGLVEDAERRGELTVGQQTINQTMGVATDIGRSDLAAKEGFPQRTTGLLTNVSNAMQPYQFDKSMQFQANMQNAANSAGLLSDIGNVAGMGMMAAGMKWSDPKMKKDIVRKTGKDENRALKLVKGTKSYDYRYKGAPSNSAKRTGLMADEAPAEIVSPDRKMINMDKQMGLLTMAAKTLAKKVEKLERRAS